MMKKWFAFLLILGTSCAYAATGHGDAHGPVEIPRQVMFQAINVTILFVGLFFLLRTGVVKFYADRRATYMAAAERSKIAREQAEKQYLEIKNKVDQLESTMDETMSFDVVFCDKAGTMLAAELYGLNIIER
ncbi:MAG: hypothetical protein EOP04_15635, partial [Proteobacteria bacterium]